MIAHQAICVEYAERRKTMPFLVIPFRLSSEYGCHLLVVFVILKDVLTVNASEHHMIDACSAFLS